MYNKQEPKTIQAMFDHIAKRYDLTNAVLSCYLHRLWNRRLVKSVRHTQPFHTLLDLCSGTGDIAFDYLRSIQIPCQAYLVDFSAGMLAHARRKAASLPQSSHVLDYIEADVQSLPFSDQMAECATMAYGIRNVKNPTQCFQEVYRVLKPGGTFGILELTRPQASILRWGHQFYLNYCLPLLGKWLTDNQDAYQYLCRSIHTFIAPEEIEQLLQQQGFISTQRISLLGGTATILLGKKPS